jgi:hypothetical protein
MPWYRLQDSALTLLGNRPQKTLTDLRLALSNTLEQAAKLEEDPDAAAAAVGQELYDQGLRWSGRAT